MKLQIVFNGEPLCIYHTEAGDFALSERIPVPPPVNADPQSPPRITLEGSWDRKFLLIAEHYAIEFMIVVSEQLVSLDTDPTVSKYDLIHRNLTRWQVETAPENIQEIVAPNSPLQNGLVVFKSDTWPVVWINQRSLTSSEHQVVQNAQQLSALNRMMIKADQSHLDSGGIGSPAHQPVLSAWYESNSKPGTKIPLAMGKSFLMKWGGIAKHTNYEPDSKGFKALMEGQPKWFLYKLSSDGKGKQQADQQAYYDSRAFGVQKSPGQTGVKPSEPG